ncbi:hypothetical protein FSS13T_27060 [Flavobacterium saliperosum S13]|uniref:Uncharacterized protein n=2 Tax=Flavobacterium saliperosum TaxID=329186 RepID=A0A1G4W593_9FLAO|nr:hypothetical protein [Flavobacterium saliperosum]ESU21548.1 hypothetical protein FSS13T_27060 [Flavobacterium saliperosum S13]SCX16969.1 hypothetical protein SAMN02927925_02462 [Flavobacterium saliperosum]
MSRKHSFVLTLSNNVTEKEGVNYLIENFTGFFKIDLATKKELLDLLKIEHRFLQAFDLIYVPSMVGRNIDTDFVQTYLEDILLIELKTTKKYLPDNPKGFFFGATENEFNFGKILGDRFRFCFVSLNEKGSSYAFLTIDELELKIKNRRIQYQINL